MLTQYTYYIIQITIIILLIGFAILLYRRNRKSLIKAKLIFAMELTLPIVSIIICLFATIRFDSITTLIIYTLAVLANTLAFFIYKGLEKYLVENQTYILNIQQEKMKQEFYDEVDSHSEEVASIRDNLIKNLTAFKKELNGDNNINYSEEVESIIDKYSHKENYDFTSHSGINALLSVKYQKALNEGIHCTFEAKISEKIKVDEIDLSVIVGNVLDNAIEACNYVEGNKYINFNIVHYKSSINISCENSTDGKVKKIKSRKGSNPNHGLGINNIKWVIDKYSGNMDYKFHDRRFTIEIAIFEEKH